MYCRHKTGRRQGGNPANNPTGESRTDLIDRNLSILKSSIRDMKPFTKDTIVLLVANPVDVLTHFAQQLADLPRAQVIGSGTELDSARLRGILARQCGVGASAIRAYVLGEHGESQVVAWSHVSIGGIPLEEAVLSSTKSDTTAAGSADEGGKGGGGGGIRIDKDAIAQETKQKASVIIQAKGSTAYGIGRVASSICRTILFDQRDVLPISHYQEDLEVCLSTPVMLGRKGVIQRIEMPLNEKEKEALAKSAESLKQVIEKAQKEG